MIEMFFGRLSPEYHTPKTRNNHIFSRAYDDENPGPGRPLTIRAAGCAECVHGKTRFGCSRACPYYGYGTAEMRGTPVLACVVAELATVGVGAVV